MEKKKPHYDLRLIKAMCQQRKVAPTRTAASGGFDLGMNLDEMISVIDSLHSHHFYKSMTSFHDHTVWHDVYLAQARNRTIYLKVCMKEIVHIISFKEK